MLKADGYILRNKIGRTARMLRQARGWTQLQLAQRLRTSRAAVSNLERGEKLPTIETLRRLAKSLEVPARVVLRLSEY